MTTPAGLFDNLLKPLPQDSTGCGRLWEDPNSKRCIHSGYLKDLKKNRKQEQKSESKKSRQKALPPASTSPKTPKRSALEAPKINTSRIQFEPNITRQVKTAKPLKASKSFQLEAINNGGLNHDGPSARKPAMKRRATFPSLDHKRASKSRNGITRGLQVRAYCTDDLSQGFPYPKVLASHGIRRADWRMFQYELISPLLRWRGHGVGIGYSVDCICDIAAVWDQQYFRRKGLIMRIDMPGEEKFGLDFMDLYYEGIRNRKTYNVGQSLIGKGHKGVMKRGQLKDLARVREKMFRGTRIVLDPLTVVDNKTLYEQRGWLQWDKQSAAAERSLLKKMAEDKLPVDNEPWDFKKMAKIDRVDRWPPSKHLYYDRWRCRQHQEHYAHPKRKAFYQPDFDSMDQRGYPKWSSVVPCDEVPHQILRRGPIEHRCERPRAWLKCLSIGRHIAIEFINIPAHHTIGAKIIHV